MSVELRPGGGKITVPGILSRKFHSSGKSAEQIQKITCLTAYDYPTARLLDEAGVDVLLVGDSVGMAVLGYDSTLPVTMDEILHHLRAVRRGTRRALLVADMPFGSFHVSLDESIRNAVRFVKEGGAEAVKVEGGERRIELISRLVEAEIPVMGHVGLTPQSVQRDGWISRAGENGGSVTAGGARCTRRGSGGSVFRGTGIGAARSGCACDGNAAHSHDWHWRRARLRWADFGVSRFCWAHARTRA